MDGVLIVVGVATVALVVGIGVGMLLARPLDRWASREPSDEEAE
jgi:hypothetical protein